MADLALFRKILTIAEELRQQGSWTGETHLQKVGYFLQELLGVPLNAEYILYKHGPYSFGLHNTLEEMRAFQYVDWRPNPYPYGPTLVEGPLGETLKRFTDEPSELRNRITFAAQSLGKKRVTELERLATALYVTLNGDRSADRSTRIHELKPHVEIADAQAAVAELDEIITAAKKLGLVQQSSLGAAS